MKNIQKLRDDLINSESNEGCSPDLTVVGKKEFDALMSRLELFKKPDNLLVFLTDLQEQLQLRRNAEIHRASGITAFTEGWLHRTAAMFKTLCESKIGDKEEILAAIDSAKLSILRSQHTGDKVAKVLVNLVNAVTQTCGDSVWKCPECGKYAAWNWDQAQEAGTPMCSECDIDMELMEPVQHIFETDEWKDAEAYALRITQIKNSKKDKS